MKSKDSVSTTKKSIGKTKMNIGITDTDRARIAKGLARFLADSYTLYS